MSGNFEGIKTQKFGVEIECTGLTRADAAKAIGKVLGSSTESSAAVTTSITSAMIKAESGLWFTIPASNAWTKTVILRREIMLLSL